MKFIKVLLAISSLVFIHPAQAAHKYTLGNAYLLEKSNTAFQHTAYLTTGVCARADEFRIKTDKKAVIEKVILRFKLSKAETFHLNTTLEKEGKTNWIGLGNYTRCVQSVSVYGYSKKKQSNIEILAREN